MIIALSAIGMSESFAQVKPTDKVANIKEKGSNVLFTISSSRPFIFGNNRYVLYIGKKDFSQYEQSKKNGKGLITFYIPSTEFKSLKDGVEMYLNYGAIDVEEQDMDALAKQSRKCWSLGKLNKSILGK